MGGGLRTFPFSSSVSPRLVRSVYSCSDLRKVAAMSLPEDGVEHQYPVSGFLS